ncbi:hypothetical protein FGW37_05455 [Streptomyces rectiverticillatus]|uniref:hypothetical protein n=1 Tax=Streptomyces rectiverticillatus TaxID=173860 RepID=UPI0015C3D48A|nr:hypothetical protein [Streptomyces rectiverticillatus]QLE71122.1 hypothetical protein FGW37_05455 [Streptomyces rectiverticillatus]
MRAPTWYMDGQLSLDRRRVREAYAIVARVEDEIPPGDPATDKLQDARAEAFVAERLFAERFMELANTDGRGVGDRFQAGDVVMDANGDLWQRARDEDVAKGWPWAYMTEGLGDAEGGLEEEHPARPLRLLIRDGRPLGGVQVRE